MCVHRGRKHRAAGALSRELAMFNTRPGMQKKTPNTPSLRSAHQRFDTGALLVYEMRSARRLERACSQSACDIATSVVSPASRGPASGLKLRD